MKKTIIFVFVLLFTSNAFALTPQEIKDICTPVGADKGKSSSTTVNGKGEIGGLTRKIGLGGELNGTHTTTEFEGGQHVSQPQQAEDNKDYRECVKHLTPKEKTTTVTKSDSIKAKKVASKPENATFSTKDSTTTIQCNATKSVCANSIGVFNNN
jgi:hypothetical protein